MGSRLQMELRDRFALLPSKQIETMRILVLGGTGFIGSALVARLAADGHECVTVSRGRGDGAHHARLDIAAATRPEDWHAALDGVDAVVNAAGAMRDGAGQSPAGVHVKGIAALYTACEARGVRRVVHLSAIGVDHEAPSAFSRTKRQGEAILSARDLDWVILRPSVVIGRAAYGGSALVRGLAALPVLPVLPQTAPIQPVHLDDVVETVVRFLEPGAPRQLALDLAGPRRIAFDDAVRMFRRWLRLRPAVSLAVPRFLAALLFRLGDLAYALGWRTPITTTAQAEMRRGAAGDPEPWQKAAGIAPRDIEAFLRCEPASVQERWFARLYALKPLVFGVFGLFWIATGLISLGPGFEYGMALLREGGLPERFGTMTLVAGALADIVIGCAILYRPLARYGLWAALIISLTYAVIGTILVPRLWADPLGPMLKIWPVLVLNLVAMAIREDR
jgi:uncharacterized protein YbjT (DUF2867 family)